MWLRWFYTKYYQKLITCFQCWFSLVWRLDYPNIKFRFERCKINVYDLAMGWYSMGFNFWTYLRRRRYVSWCNWNSWCISILISNDNNASWITSTDLLYTILNLLYFPSFNMQLILYHKFWNKSNNHWFIMCQFYF